MPGQQVHGRRVVRARCATCLLACPRQPVVWVQVAAGKVDGWGAAVGGKVAAAGGAVEGVGTAGGGGGGAQEALAVLRKERGQCAAVPFGTALQRAAPRCPWLAWAAHPFCSFGARLAGVWAECAAAACCQSHLQKHAPTPAHTANPWGSSLASPGGEGPALSGRWRHGAPTAPPWRSWCPLRSAARWPVPSPGSLGRPCRGREGQGGPPQVA